MSKPTLKGGSLEALAQDVSGEVLRNIEFNVTIIVRAPGREPSIVHGILANFAVEPTPDNCFVMARIRNAVREI